MAKTGTAAKGGRPAIQRIGLSATQRPLERIGRYLVGPERHCEIVDSARKKDLDLEIVVPVDDMANPVVSDQTMGGPGEGHVRSIWPAIYPELLALVREHRSTIVFVNNRRGAERLAQRLNDLDEETRGLDPDRPGKEEEPVLARAHHGSLSHEERSKVEELLKSGEIPCLIATSSLELGIDMGAVDLVIQVESPKSVSRGLQRIGRAGHGLGETSKGRIFPKYRGDLLESAVVVERMRAGAIEETVIPTNPLDVLAQQVPVGERGLHHDHQQRAGRAHQQGAGDGQRRVMPGHEQQRAGSHARPAAPEYAPPAPAPDKRIAHEARQHHTQSEGAQVQPANGVAEV